MDCICAPGIVAAVHTLFRDPDNLDTIILMNQESDLPECGGGRVLSAAARRSLCQHKTQSTFSSQFLSQPGPGPRKIMSRDVSCQIPRIRGKAGVINYKRPEIG